METTISSVGEHLEVLPNLTEDELTILDSRLKDELLRRKTTGLSNKGKLVPMISTTAKIVVLPEDCNGVGSYALNYMALLAHRLGYTVQKIPYNQTMIQISEYFREIALGIFLSLDDVDHKINIDKKKGNWETARTWVRAQQIIGFVASHGLGTEVLKRNQTFFGNNPKDSVLVGKTLVPTLPLAKELQGVFEHQAWAEKLRQILVTLTRQSYQLLTSRIVESVNQSILPVEEMIRLYCTQEIVIREPNPRKKDPGEYKYRVPSKPKASVLLTKEEFKFLSELIAPVFGKTHYEELTFSEWVNTLMTEGFKKILKRLQSEYSKRKNFLQKFGALTSTRLRQIKGSLTDQKTIRKKDVNPEKVNELIVGRTDPYSEFAIEICRLDPTGEFFIKENFAVDLGNGKGKELPSWATLQTEIQRKALREGLYKGLIKPVVTPEKEEATVPKSHTVAPQEGKGKEKASTIRILPTKQVPVSFKTEVPLSQKAEEDIDEIIEKARKENPLPILSLNKFNTLPREEEEVMYIKEKDSLINEEEFDSKIKERVESGQTDTQALQTTLWECWNSNQQLPKKYVKVEDALKKGKSNTVKFSLVCRLLRNLYTIY